MSKEIAQTVSGKRIAWLIAIVAALAVFATLSSQWSKASAASSAEPVDSYITTASINDDLTAPDSSLPDIRGSTTSAVSDVANFSAGIIDFITSTIGNTAAQSPPLEFWAFVAVTVAFAVLLRVATAGTLVENANPYYIRRQEMGHHGHRQTKCASHGLAFSGSASYNTHSGISKRSGLRRASNNILSQIRMITTSSAKHIGAGFAYPIIAPIMAGHNFVTRRTNELATSGETDLLHRSNIEYGRTIARDSPSSSKPHEWHPRPTAFAMLN